ncbi:MAG: membrane protein insertase YidC [Clostridiales bacterium]|jgi:YidC/Oxa1 family membrane protein insertase|nr:membrane protein insertase YidC [Clostridiales bacterium]
MTTYERIMSVIAIPMGWILTLLYDFINNYGIALIVFTILIRACLFPVYNSQIKNSAKLKEFQPKMQELQRKYANDKETLNIKMMELYKEENFNPAGGCLPLLIQMPIILAFFVLIRNPIAFMSDPQMLMAVHESFLWIPDLSQPDPWILPILAGLATFFSFSMTQTMASPDVGGTAGMMKMMRFFFPIMIVWMGRAFPSALTLYWFIGTLFMIGQTLLMNKIKERKGLN